jgi:cyclopropane fatty-acyl-phospholipid synthase-like methyltransferase
MKISPNGAWDISSNDNGEHVFDRELAASILSFLNTEGVTECVDLGCGDGRYVKFLKANGIAAKGYDGNHNTYELSNGACQVQDLSVTFDLGKKFDCVLSLEVGEHIPKQFESIFIDNIIKHTKDLVILSWAVPGQGGDGHVNCQTNKYIKSLFSAKGFSNLIDTEVFLRRSTVYKRFADTVMVFKIKG